MKFSKLLSSVVVLGFASAGAVQAATYSYDIDPNVVIQPGQAVFGDLNDDKINDLISVVNGSGDFATLGGVRGFSQFDNTQGIPTRATVSFVLADLKGYAINVGQGAKIDNDAQKTYIGEWVSLADGPSGSVDGTAAVLFDRRGGASNGALAGDDSRGFFALRTDHYSIQRNSNQTLKYVYSGRTYSWIEIYSGSGLRGTRGGFSTDASKDEGVITPTPSPVPLPAGLPLMALALGGLAVVRRKSA